MKTSRKKLTSVFIFFILGYSTCYAQQSVSIGDTQVKANAVLYLKGNGSQGFIIPVVASNGSFGEAGMIVYNSTEKKLYYHNGTSWVDASGSTFTEADGIIGNEVSQVNTARGGLEITGSGTNANPLSVGLIQGTTDGQVLRWNNTTKKWELGNISNADNQDLSLSGTTLSLTNDATPVTLGGLAILNTVGSTQITDGTITNADISNTASIAVSKLAPGSNGQVLTINAGTATWQTPTSATTLNGLTDVTVTTPTAGQVLVNDGAGQFKNMALSGDIAVNASGAATLQAGAVSGGAGGDIADGSIVNADIGTSSAIAGTKISPDFGSQNITTLGKTSFNSITYTWPNTQGAANTFLKNDGSGNISWAMVSSFSNANSVPKGDGTGLTASSIYDNGNVGIGTTSPATKLQIDDTTPTLRLRSTVTSSLSDSFVEFGHDDGSGGFVSAGSIGDVGSGDYLQIHSPSQLSFNTNFATRMTVSNNGYVGIGTTSPGYNLHVTGSNPSIVIEENGTSNANLIFQRDGAQKWYLLENYLSPTDNIAFYDASTSSKVFQINQGGNVGIGTTDPTTKLEVNGYTKLGSDNTSASDYSPAIKVKKLLTTTSATQGGCAFVTHGITPGKIIGVQVIVEYSANTYIQPSYTFNTGYEYNWIINPSGSIQICLISGNSANILSKPAIILITYEQ